MGHFAGNTPSNTTTGNESRNRSNNDAAIVGAFAELAPEFSIVIPTRRRLELLLELLHRLDNMKGPSKEVIVVDDASESRICDVVRCRFPHVRVLRNQAPRGFDSLGDAVEMARGTYVVQLDDDAYPQEDTLQRLRSHFEERGPTLAMIAMPFVEPESGRNAYSPYLPEVPAGETFAPANGFIAGAVAVRREAALQVPLSPRGYFMYETEVPTAIEYLKRDWEIDYLPSAKVFHIWEAKGRKSEARQAYLSLRNDLVTINKYFLGWRRREMLVGRYLAGFMHLLSAGKPHQVLGARRSALQMLKRDVTENATTGSRSRDRADRGEVLLPRKVRERVYSSFDGLTLLTFFGESNRRRLAWLLGFLPVDQSA